MFREVKVRQVPKVAKVQRCVIALLEALMQSLFDNSHLL